jgi:methionine sulfoxide reductase heme-binding subunit
MSELAAAGPSAYWYLTRSTGAVSLLLLTASVVIGVLGSLRFAAAPRWPRFAIERVHRDISLLALALLALHIITSVLDRFAPIALADAVIPFGSSYRPLWLGLGALSFDMLLAVTVSSLLRRRLGYSTWRAIHWLAYASWPVAVLHGLGAGSDTKVWWMLLLTGLCLGAVLLAVWVRLARTRSQPASGRALAFALSVLTPVGIAVFVLAGPLRRGWARRAGTPVALLARAPASAPVPAGRARASATSVVAPFSTSLVGTARQSAAAGGAIVDLALRLTGGVRGRLRVRLAGAPLDGGGLSLTGSQVDLILHASGSVMEGRITSLQGQQLIARVASSSGSVLDLHADLNIDPAGRAVTGTLTGAPPGSGR